MPPLSDFFHLRAVYQTGSTNDDAAKAAREGAVEGTLIWARRQTKGRGRRGRCWVSPEGNLHLSIILRPDVPPMRAGETAFVAALASADACKSLAPNSNIRCKWPNDILVDGRKVGGLLVESSILAGRIEWLVVGVGINLASHPDGMEFPATHLARHAGKAVAVEEGLVAIRAAWLQSAAGLGDPIRVRLDEEELFGTFVGLDSDGALKLSFPDGSQRRIMAGDVFFPDATVTE
jgi:BirA family transcriptional regulator, biotin operon repressor / biotin---[acetyl-CoA-carboxylase] ligase